MTENKTTKKALQLQVAVHRLKTGRQKDFIRMGGCLKQIKEKRHYRNMGPHYFSKWGLYLYSEKISGTLAENAIRAFEILQGLKKLVDVVEYKTFHTLMINMHPTNLNILCHRTVEEIAELLKQGCADWTCNKLRGEVYRIQGRPPMEPKKYLSWNKKELAHMLNSLDSSIAPKGQKLLRKAMITQLQRALESFRTS